MNTIKTVGIKALKDQLSSYLRDVKAGVIVLITDRGQVIAELQQPSVAGRSAKNESLKEEWIHDGKLIPGKSQKQKYQPSPVALKDGTARKLIDQDRE